MWVLGIEPGPLGEQQVLLGHLSSLTFPLLSCHRRGSLQLLLSSCNCQEKLRVPFLIYPHTGLWGETATAELPQKKGRDKEEAEPPE